MNKGIAKYSAANPYAYPAKESGNIEASCTQPDAKLTAVFITLGVLASSLQFLFLLIDHVPRIIDQALPITPDRWPFHWLLLHFFVCLLSLIGQLYCGVRLVNTPNGFGKGLLYSSMLFILFSFLLVLFMLGSCLSWHNLRQS